MSDYEIFTITISIFAIATSFLALGWNIYRDVILKPRLKVRFQISIIVHGKYKSPSKISIRATNFGPSKIRCTGINANTATLWKRIFGQVKYAEVIEDYTDKYSTRLPCELDVGHTCQLYLPFVENCLLGEPYTHVGISDSFGRTHWAPKKDIAKARKRYDEEFAQKSQKDNTHQSVVI